MALTTFKLHNDQAAVLAEFSLDLWQGNRDKTNRQILAIGQSLFSYLAYQDIESKIAVFGGLGNLGEAWAEAHLSTLNWKKEGAVSVDYLLRGRLKTAVFTRNHDLLHKIAEPGKSIFVNDASTAFDKVTPWRRTP